jgi:hypothetical protein
VSYTEYPRLALEFERRGAIFYGDSPWCLRRESGSTFTVRDFLARPFEQGEVYGQAVRDLVVQSDKTLAQTKEYHELKIRS